MARSPSWIDPDAFARTLGEDPWDPEPGGSLAPSTPPAPADGATASTRPPRRDLVVPLSRLPTGAIGELETRSRLFTRWMQTLVGERPFFVTDAEGLVLIAERVPADRAIVGTILERALRVVRPFVGSARASGAHVALEDGQLVQMMWHRTERGRVMLGVFGEPLLDPDRVRWVGRALEQVFAKESTP